MRKSLFIYILLLVSAAAMAQRKPAKSIVYIIQSDRSVGVNEEMIKVYNGTFRQENTTLRADSSYFYPKRNSFDAFGNVHINQGDTLNVYSDKLYYNGTSHVALLTNNVRLVDRDATLTTNYLTYNTATKIGTYTGGGKLVNKDNTLISQNGYYFANTRDAYFRYNVVLTTIDAVIKTDTLRYNSGTRISYFFGPTHILGKDKDTLYTEKGNYNTITEQAFFSKNNLYTQGTKSLKGDSLFYDRLKGYGRAVRNITFNDNEQKVTIKGNLGTYYRADERAVVTQDPYVIMVTEERDTTQNKMTAAQPLLKAKRDKTTVVKPKVPANTKPLAKVGTHVSDKGTLTTDSIAIKPPPRIKRDSIYWGADTLETQILTYKKLRELQERMRLSGIRDTSLKDKPKPVKKIPLKVSTTKTLIAMPPADIKIDMSFLKPDLFGAPKAPDTTQKKLPVIAKDSSAKKPVKAVAQPKDIRLDSVYMTRKLNLSDTARIRILSAHHNAKIFKSDLQSKADSMFYSYADSTMRCFVNPMIWTQGSQLSGDTIYLQLKNKKLDNMDLWPNAFTVNIEAPDSTHFNQVAGKKMRGFFVANKLQRMFVDGNAETIYFNRDSTKKEVTDLMRSISSRIRVNFKDNKASNITLYTKVEQRILPIAKAVDDDKILKGFIWKPKERPESKEAIISPTKLKPPGKKGAAGKTPAKSPPGKGKPVLPGAKKPVIDSAGKALPVIDSATTKMVTDSVLKVLPGLPGSSKLPALKKVPAVIDSVKKKVGKDTARVVKP
ncbi:OstA-like protein [Mucilaginibacter terrae]|uniref:OstA-like protein n=1 Tax=Mucilaginibacter terrae TaxID=1955052 RepID=UPI0036289AC5